MALELRLAKLRKQAGWSRDRAAVEARVAYAICRLYEANPDAVVNADARSRLDAVYARIKVEALHDGFRRAGGV
jgi:hypothetical protein